MYPLLALYIVSWKLNREIYLLMRMHQLVQVRNFLLHFVLMLFDQGMVAVLLLNLPLVQFVRQLLLEVVVQL